ncbi:MAG: hypothetical protein RLZ68_245 [Pseudomonadota bacterium]
MNEPDGVSLGGAITLSTSGPSFGLYWPNPHAECRATRPFQARFGWLDLLSLAQLAGSSRLGRLVRGVPLKNWTASIEHGTKPAA